MVVQVSFKVFVSILKLPEFLGSTMGLRNYYKSATKLRRREVYFVQPLS